MDAFTWNVTLAAVGLAVVHTLLGPDHTLPFALLARARGWSLRRTVVVTALCGAAHVLSSLALGGLGIAAGLGVGRLESLDGFRGDAAAWCLVAFGAAYALFGVRAGLRRRAGLITHAHGGRVHVHFGGAEAHDHRRDAGSRAAFWTLLLVLVLGPCEPLIPLFMLPASRGDWSAAALAAAVYAAATLATMVAVVAACHVGLGPLARWPLARWSHALAGSVVAASGGAALLL